MPTNQNRLPVLFLVALSVTCSDPTGPADRTDRLVFGSPQANGDWEIWSAMPDGSKLLRLTRSPGIDIQPSLSNDRRLIAFYSRRSPSGIYVMNADGTGLTFLCQVENVAVRLDWSPDDRYIVYQDFSTGVGPTIHVVEVESGQRTFIASGVSAPDWSPDGTAIAVSGGSPVGIYLMNPDGSNLRLLIPDAIDPAFSPDGTLLAFVNGNRDGVAVASVTGAGRRVVNGSTSLSGAIDQGPIWSRNGARIAFMRTESAIASIYTVRVDGSDLRKTIVIGGSDGGVTW